MKSEEKKLPETDEEIEFTPQGLGKLMFSNQEIKIILESEDDESFENEVLRGQLITQAEMRFTVIRQSKNGSSEAQKMIEKWRQELNLLTAM